MITLALRTPLCKYKKGALKDTPLDALVFKTLQQVRQRCNLDPSLVGDMYVYCALHTLEYLLTRISSPTAVLEMCAMESLVITVVPLFSPRAFQTALAPRTPRDSALPA